jgi:hypothetical protein
VATLEPPVGTELLDGATPPHRMPMDLPNGKLEQPVPLYVLASFV